MAKTTAQRRQEWVAQSLVPSANNKGTRAMIAYNVLAAHDYNAGDARRFDTGGNDYSGQGKPADGRMIRKGLADLGWTEHLTETGTRMVHPDGLVQLRFEPHGDKSERTYFEPVAR